MLPCVNGTPGVQTPLLQPPPKSSELIRKAQGFDEELESLEDTELEDTELEDLELEDTRLEDLELEDLELEDLELEDTELKDLSLLPDAE